MEEVRRFDIWYYRDLLDEKDACDNCGVLITKHKWVDMEGPPLYLIVNCSLKERANVSTRNSVL